MEHAVRRNDAKLQKTLQAWQRAGCKDELSPEEKIRINMVNEPILMDGSIYTLTVNGRDLASNDSETIIVSNILYDITPPSFLLGLHL